MVGYLMTGLERMCRMYEVLSTTNSLCPEDCPVSGTHLAGQMQEIQDIRRKVEN